MSDDFNRLGAVAKRLVDRPLKVLPTHYNGVTYRSRTESRWAVFFDVIEVKFQYEPEGYDLDGIWYLPDFYIPVWDLYIEVKGSGHDLTGHETDKAQRCAWGSGKHVLAVFGDPGMDKGRLFFPTPNDYGKPNNSFIRNCRGCDLLVVWSCWDVGSQNLPLGRCIDDEICGERQCSESIGMKLERAIDAARNYRFSKEDHNRGVA